MSHRIAMLWAMAICTDCNLDMTTADGCTVGTLTLDGRRFDRRPVSTDRCGDCGATRGHHHHLGCDMATCPACGWQLLSCGCAFDEYGPELAFLIELGNDGTLVGDELASDLAMTELRAPGLLPV